MRFVPYTAIWRDVERDGATTMLTELVAGTARLLMDCDLSQWCQVILDADGLHPLGSETRSVFVERLVRGLRDELPGPTSGELEGVPVAWVLSLSERHTSIYAADREGVRTLYFQNADGKLIARVNLGREVRERWLSILEELVT
jgi:hypothetical protein